MTTDRRGRAALTHVGRRGARMVDVGHKRETAREAVARGEVGMRASTLRMITEGVARKGDVLTVAQVAGIASAKRTWELIPLCHPIPMTGIAVTLTPDAARGRLVIEARVRTRGRTGAEMEALVAVATAALTVYDMVKAVERGVVIDGIRLVRKSGGKSGPYLWNGRGARATR
ncbi:MAG TPA: cyclic pyranopterin monophosphate synthase MoaC [bacterium]|nr:cyclic pyranopterin monophosphate synthase MoaC [bacterium]